MIIHDPEIASSATIGVVAICFNEERDLPAFIEHLVPWVKEIIIVDDGSTDRTHEIARQYGSQVRVLISPRGASGSWAEQRNKGIDAAESDWLLHMDIDERVPPMLAEEIRREICNADRDAYRYRRLNFFLHRPMRSGGWERWNNIQLARRGILRFTGIIHERAELKCGPERVGQLQSKMWHLNDESWEERMAKSLRYCIVEGRKLAERGEPVCWYHIILRPVWAFFKTFILLRGYRDGLMGIILATHNFGAVFHWQVIAWEKQNRIPRDSLEHQSRVGYER